MIVCRQAAYANAFASMICFQHIFSLEQEEYQAEGVKWANITYCDNQALLDLFLKRPIGILALLDEESHFPQVLYNIGKTLDLRVVLSSTNMLIIIITGYR